MPSYALNSLFAVVERALIGIRRDFGTHFYFVRPVNKLNKISNLIILNNETNELLEMYETYYQIALFWLRQRVSNTCCKATYSKPYFIKFEKLNIK